MTLKDFHGGSIPSDLPLPSAPGVTARPPDRPLPGGAWGSAGRPDLHRPRPGSAGGSRALDPPFLPHIGRHFDEDERKPFDSSAASPRRPDPVRPLPPPPSTKQRPLSSPAASHAPVPVPVPAFHPPPGSAPNAWAARNPAVEPPAPANPVTTVWSGPAAASRLAHASAIEKVSSGRWHSKPPPDVEVIKFQEVEGLIESIDITANGDRAARERRDYERVVSPVEVGRNQERVRSPMYTERNATSSHLDSASPTSREGNLSGHQQGIAEVLERPKLNLLAKKKSPDQYENPPFVEKQGYPHPVELAYVEKVEQIQAGINVQRPGSAGADAGPRAIERPKLNLKPRSLPVEQSAEIAERERRSVFGGARPRELVLKERGIDNFAVNNYDVPSPTNRAKSDLASPLPRHGGRAETYSPEQWIGRDVEKKDYRPNTEKPDPGQMASWRNSKDMEKQPESQRQEPDTWRKPVEQPKPDDAAGPRFGKVASALELAQAFSKPVADTRVASKSLPGRTQVPFSRLTAQKQINGY